MDAPYYNGSDDREDRCTEDYDTCPCPACENWRLNRGPEDEVDSKAAIEAAAEKRSA